MKNKFVGIIYIFLAITILILHILGVNSTSNDGISKVNAKTTQATIVGIVFIIYYIYKSVVSKDVIDKSLKLKVIQIDVIDYERELVFFSGNNQLVYLYDTDFGEDFKTNQIYTVSLSANNQKTIYTDFQGQNIRVIQIVNIEKSSFIIE